MELADDKLENSSWKFIPNNKHQSTCSSWAKINQN